MRNFGLVLVLAACGGSSDAPPDGAPDTLDAAPGYRAEILQSSTFARDGRSFPVKLVRITRPDGKPTYVHWIGSDRPAPWPTVVSTDPYGGIAWSEDAVDLRWAARGAGVYEDTEQPDYDGSAQITYQPRERR